MNEGAPLRIVHLLRPPFGGLMRHVRDLVLAQSAQGHEVGIVCDAPGTVGYHESTLESLKPRLSLGVHRVAIARSVGLSDIGAARTVLSILRPMQPDIVHGHSAKGGVYARALGALSNRRARPARLYSPHGGSLHYDPDSRAGKVYFAIERFLERSCETILFVADYERRTYAAKIGEPRCPTRIVYNGLADSEFEPVTTTADAGDFLFIGEMRLLKGPDLFVEAIGRLRAEGRPINAVMVGHGPDRDQIAAQVERDGLSDAIDLRPAMPAREAFALARTVVIPSRAEAMPYIVLEALAAGRPLIATDVGGIGEIMGDNRRALVEPDAAALALAMAGALDKPDALAAMMPSTAALKARFSAAVMAEGVMNAYREALTRARANGNNTAQPQSAPRSSNVS